MNFSSPFFSAGSSPRKARDFIKYQAGYKSNYPASTILKRTFLYHL